jgi:hypothetical protein
MCIRSIVTALAGDSKMIGADEKTALDIHGNSTFVGSANGVARYLNTVKGLGFEVRGNTVLSTKHEIEVALFRTNKLAANHAHDWKPKPKEGPAMQCSICGKEEY